MPVADDNHTNLSELEDFSHKATGEKSVEPLSSGEGCYENSITNSDENAGEKSIEPPPYSPLTPRPLNLPACVFDKKSMDLPSTTNTLEDARESLEPQPHSPLTLRPLGNFNARVFEKRCMKAFCSNIKLVKSPNSHVLPHETITGKSIETPVFSPLTPRPKQSTTSDPLSSPLRPMSPETTDLYNMLTEDLDNVCDTPENIFSIDENHPTAPSASSNTTEIMFNTDDSVQDPDFVCNDDTDGSDSSSGKSVSLITTLAEVYETCADANGIQTSSHSNQIPQVNITETDTSSQGRPKKGRKRLYGGYTREERKKRKYTNLSYVNSRKQNIDPKPFLDYSCNCPKECQETISNENRLTEFRKFYALGSYDAQNMFLAACVKEKPVKRSYVTVSSDNSKKKTYTREYYLKDVLVCKKMFLKTLQTTSKRVNTSLCKKRNNCINDKRGKMQGVHNKATSEDEAFLINVIKKLPTYVSHYRRANCNDTKFLRSDMTCPNIYKLYSDEANVAGQKVLSYAKFKHVFLTKFNLRTKPLKKDTCNKCDYYDSKKKQASEEEKALVEDAHSKHLQKAQFLQNQLKIDRKLAQEDPCTETITFDLQKTLPLPRIPTNVVFYKRQLWVYNLGIHTGSNDQAHCNVWVEGEAGRGSQEVGSCLIKHVIERLGGGVKHLILWSDSCGGQNRNIKLTLMLKALLDDHPKLQTIRLRFLESGHSFLPNDTDFGRIECALKLQQRLYTPEDYIQIMKNCKKKKPMSVHRMRKEDFLSSAKLEKRITNRKKATDGSKVSWLNTKEIMLKKEDVFSIFMRCNLDEEYIMEVNIKKNVRGGIARLTLDLMDLRWPKGKPIPEPKLKDLKSLLHLIPEDAQYFYKNLTGDGTVQDDIDGFSGEVDFEVEVDDCD